MANISIKQDSNTKDSGRIICLMEEEKLSTPTKAGIMEISSITNGMERASSCKRSASLKDNSYRISYKELPPCEIKTEKNMKDNGNKIKNTEKANILGQMEINTKAPTN